MAKLFEPIHLRDVTLKNRIVIPPMCQYVACDGLASHWHLVHLGSRAVGGAGLVIVEATAVSPVGRISLGDLGLWNVAQAEAFRPIVEFIHSQGATAGIQISHSGRKGSAHVPWVGRSSLTVEQGGWPTVGPWHDAYSENYVPPRIMQEDDIECIVGEFARTAHLAATAGFRVLELHMGHGYLLHSFLSSLSNHRSDAYGGSFERRIAFPMRVVDAVREVWPDDLPLFVRLSVHDGLPGGWELEQSTEFALRLRQAGVDAIDCSSGSINGAAKAAPTYDDQIASARHLREHAALATCAVGGVTDPVRANELVESGGADLVAVGRASLRDPYWALHAHHILLGTHDVWPLPYQRAVTGASGGGSQTMRDHSFGDKR